MAGARHTASLAALATSMRNRDLRRAQSSFAASWTSEWALTVVVGVIAYGEGVTFAEPKSSAATSVLEALRAREWASATVATHERGRDRRR